jgi:outer membrane protein
MIPILLMLAAQDTTRLTIVAATELSLAHYPTVAVARARVGGAEAEVRESRAARLPRLTLDASATRWELPSLAFPIHGIPTSTGEPPPGGRLVFDESTYQASAFLDWTLLDFGARGAKVRASRRLEDAAGAALDSAGQELIARTAIAYLEVLSARQVLAAQDERLNALEAEVARARRLFTEGRGARVAALRAEAELARARAERAGAAGRQDVAQRDLARLVNVEAVGPLAAVALRDTLPPDRETAVAHAREASPDLLEATRRMDAAASVADAVRAGRFPEVRLAAGIVPRASSDEIRTEWQAGLAMNWPLYTGGERSARIAGADADRSAATEERRLVELDIAEAVDRAIAAVVEARARVVALEAAVQASDAVAETERTALEVGAGTQTDYLDALADQLREAAGLIEARHLEIAARIALVRVTGRLEPAWLEQTLESR